MNCWEILALQPGAEERDIKRRYAQLVKNCRPEDDPAAWQQLHDAYEPVSYTHLTLPTICSV